MKTKTFTVKVTSPFPGGVSERAIKRTLEFSLKSCAVVVSEVNKTSTCDGCDKERRDVKACGKDSNGDPDAPVLCFFCRKEATRNRVWDRALGKYVHESVRGKQLTFA